MSIPMNGSGPALLPEDFEYFRKALLAASGISLSGAKKDFVQSRLLRRLFALKLESFADYRKLLSSQSPGSGEWQLLINSLTTNKTDFFREPHHFDYLMKVFLPSWEARNPGGKLRIWSAASSTGEEPYTLAMVMQRHFKDPRRFEILASDIDTAVLARARNGVYPMSRIEEIPLEYRQASVAQGREELSRWFKVRKELQSAIDFKHINLKDFDPSRMGKFDLIFCRNVFIYFEPKFIEDIVEKFWKMSNPGALLVIGTSESLQNVRHGWQLFGSSIYCPRALEADQPLPKSAFESMPRKKRVLIVDDSKPIQQILTKVFSQSAHLEVAAAIGNPFDVEKAIETYRPDVMTLDIHMPGMNGCEVLDKLLPKHPIPTIMISALGLEESDLVLKALDLGAVDYLQKPAASEITQLASVMIEKVLAASEAKVIVRARSTKSATAIEKPSAPKARALASRSAGDLFIAIGSSTGGPQAVEHVLTQLPADIPPICITQHIPPDFSKAFAARLNQLCPFEIKEAEDGDLLLPGRVLIAPGGRHLTVEKSDRGFIARVRDGELVNRHKPSVDVLFESFARNIGGNTIGVILTGMGDDGAKGLLSMRKAGARTIAQDEASCVVFGMPREAIELGAAERVCSLQTIPAVLKQWIEQKPSGKAKPAA